jgi:hypothetical protein
VFINQEPSHLEGLKQSCSKKAVLHHPPGREPFSSISKTECYLVVCCGKLSNGDTKCVLSFSFQFHSFVYYYYGSVAL